MPSFFNTTYLDYQLPKIWDFLKIVPKIKLSFVISGEEWGVFSHFYKNSTPFNWRFFSINRAKTKKGALTPSIFFSDPKENISTPSFFVIFMTFYFLFLVYEGSILILVMSLIKSVNSKKAILSLISINFVFGQPPFLFNRQSSWISTSSRTVVW